MDTGTQDQLQPSDLRGNPQSGPPHNIPGAGSKNTTLPSSGSSLRVVQYEYDDDHPDKLKDVKQKSKQTKETENTFGCLILGPCLT